jgi:hypothetical protein
VINTMYWSRWVPRWPLRKKYSGFTADLRGYPRSSYGALLGDRPTRLCRAEALSWFGGRAGFEEFHAREDLPGLEDLAGLVGDGDLER